MDTLTWKLLRRLRPRVGWAIFLPALLAALCPAIAASESTLALPSTVFGWAALIGLPLGLWFGRARRPPTGGQFSIRSTAGGAARLLVRLALVVALGVLLLIAAARALPPLGLLFQDTGALTGWAAAALRREARFDTFPAARTWTYLSAAVPRAWSALLEAPGAGEAGARLLVAAGGITATLLGAIVLGWALARRRSLLAWGIPMLAAIAFTDILGANSGIILLGGLLLLLVLAIAAEFNRRELAWQRTGTDYSDELRFDLLGWGGLAAAIVLVLAILLPTSIDNPIANLLWRDVELPSGIAVLERNIQRPKPVPQAEVGLSSLPALQLGLSLEDPPPGEIILRVHVGAPFKPSPWPHYWRARVFNQYTGAGWTQNARVGAFPQVAPVAGAVPDAIIQEIEDLRENRSVLVALPDAFAIDAAVQAERLADGTLAALTGGDASRYRVASRPQELASPPPFDQPAPDLSGYLALPRGYSPRVTDLARAVAGAGDSPYAQALALEAYLRALPYSYQVRPLPGRGDAVEQFLFDMGQGYCTYYASAMAVMARTLGIPARVAAGYATGDYDPASGAYLVRQSDAHAWPELYLDGRWLPFEPTPIRALPARNAPGAAPEPQVAQEPAAQPDRLTGPLIWALALAAVAALGALGFWWGRPRKPQPLATQVQRRLERAGARAGVAWPAGATLHEYGQLLEPQASGAGDALHEVVDLVERARYSGLPLDSTQDRRLRAAAERLWARLGGR